jgi:hypothetical protein
MRKWIKWINENVYHLDVATLNAIASVVLFVVLYWIYDSVWLWMLFIANVVLALMNYFMSWYEDEFNKRKWKQRS